ncbi:hypothetical protein WR25_04484 [Diploscapter pachys]|uniref:Uncharacterized protein n=1 Tax=Diploscapter pachys TaxID=2018661 RepID=A0A2A2LFQ9_9BILA|nr:hypothetical protein WR25_04484 [Diploscapter pachys]
MSSFEAEDRRAKYAVMPKSSNEGKMVKLEPKKLKTNKEVRTILPEEKYLDKLEKIIVRDYFPELPKLKAQAEYMDAQARNDVAKMRELQLRFKTQRRTDRRTSPSGRLATSPERRATSPTRFDPDAPGPSGTGKPDRIDPSPMPYANQEGDNDAESTTSSKTMKASSSKKKDPASLSIDEYLNKYTSEDNASFEELTQIMRKKELAAKAWAFNAEKEHNQGKIAYGSMAADADVQLALRYNPEAASEKPRDLDNWSYRAVNTVLFQIEGAPLTDAEKIELAKKNQRVINKNATRFPEDTKVKPSEISMARAQMMQAAVNLGRINVHGQEAVLPNAIDLLSTPSPGPGVEASPLMTWGEIDGTPFRLDAPDVDTSMSSAPAFKIPEVPYREQIHQKIHDTIVDRYHQKRKLAMNAIEKAHRSPRFGSTRSTDKLSVLSPAARRLATNKLGIKLTSPAEKFRSPTPSRTQSTGVTGKLICDDGPAANVLVKLYEHDKLTPDELMDSTTTDSEGNFKLSGSADEISSIEPKINIYHDCNDGIKPCQRKVTIFIPMAYVQNVKTPSKFYDLGTMQLSAVYPDESRDCLH